MKIKSLILLTSLGGFILMVAVNIRQSGKIYPAPAIGQTNGHLLTQNGVGVAFAGEVPTWADEVVTIMAKLEQWRGKAFSQDLQVTFLSDADHDVAGSYNSQTKQLVVSGGGSDRFGQGVMVHEICHALQDQTFDLFALQSQTTTPDQNKALVAMIEGEAMLAVSELMAYDFEAQAQLPATGIVSDELFEKLFLYTAGMQFVRTLREVGGWDAVDAAFKDPPGSTTLIFHPERYLAGEREVAAINIAIEAGAQLQSTEVQGEYGVRLWLVRDPNTRPLVELAGSAYEADTLAILTDANGQTIYRWVIEFSHPTVAASMGEAAVEILSQRDEIFMVEVFGKSITLEWQG